MLANIALYTLVVLIWGTVWIVTKYQLGVVAPELSIAYRFFIASFSLFIVCVLQKKTLRFTLREHVRMVLQGVLFFGINFFLLYTSAFYLKSGLMAVIFSGLIFMTMLNNILFFKISVSVPVVVGAVFGIVGIGCLFSADLTSFQASQSTLIGFGCALSACYVASLGNIISQRNQKAGLPVLPSTAYAMLYGGGVNFLFAIAQGKPLTFETTWSYTLGVIYLGVLGSALIFTLYLRLVGRVGADRAAYVLLFVPIVALLISTYVENLQLTWLSLVGITLVFVGGVFVLRTPAVPPSSTLEQAVPPEVVAKEAA